jgi:16S rRNA (cytosine967-C5)-methyltransferase
VSGPSARRVALNALARIDDGAYANLVLPPLLERSGLDERDRRFVTDLVYGTTRMRRACDFLVDRFLVRTELDADVRSALRLGAYQLHFLRTPPHAAVGETVDEVKGKARGLVNAVLRKVAGAPVEWPDDATRLSYPDWIVDRLSHDLGREVAVGALESMNEAATVHERPDGYVQDPASQDVARIVGARPGERVADVCAAPGGKATLIAELGSPDVVVAGDASPTRTTLVAGNVRLTGQQERVAVVVADARRPPHPEETFDRVLVDAPCSGLGVLRRRPDARWRIQERDVDDLVRLQREILEAAVRLVRPGGRLVYSVCTLTKAEGPDIGRWLLDTHNDLALVDPPGEPWQPLEVGALLLPQTAQTDGMYVTGFARVAQ